MNSSAVHVPNEPEMEGAISKAKHSKCGRDGVPYAAYKAVPKFACKVLALVANSLATAAPPEGFNVQNVLFSPKGKEARDNNIPSRAVVNLRTTLSPEH